MAGKTTPTTNLGHLAKRRQRKRIKMPPNPRIKEIRIALDHLRKERATFPSDHYKRVSQIEKAMRAFQDELSHLEKETQ